MDNTTAFFSVIMLLLAWIYVVYAAWKSSAENNATDYLYLALALWPIGLVDSAVRIASVPDWFAIAGVFHFIPATVVVCVLHHVQKKLQPHYPIPMWISACLVLAAIVSELPLLLQTVNIGDWISDLPVGNPALYWWVYLPYLVLGCCLMVSSGQIIEVCRRYHRYLPWQAVDINRYKVPFLSVIAGAILLLSAVSLLLVIAMAGQLFIMQNWPIIIDLSISLVLLAMLYVAVQAKQALPSPLHYSRIYSATSKSPSDDDKIIAQAEKTIIAGKGYKIIGLTVDEFARTAGVEPTSLVLALRRKKKQDFRGFIFHYRMEYARNVVMRTDTSIANIAKRLGFHSEKFLSGPFLSYLKKHK